MASESGPARLLTMLVRVTHRACIVSVLACVAIGCSKEEALQAGASTGVRPQSVYTVNYPLAYFAKRLAPEGVEVVFPAPPDVDPAFWKPTPDAIGLYQGAGLILLNGVGYARWARYATLPESRIVVTATRCRDAFLQTGEAATHQHGPDGEHAHEDIAFTTWLDMRLARCQARHVADALAELTPAQREAIMAESATLDDDLAKIDARLRAAGRAWGAQPILASHPVYQYLADAYDMRIESMHLEPDHPLSPEDIQALDALLARHPAKLMLWEAQPLPASEEQLRARGVTSIVFDPAAQPPADGDFLTVMTANAKRLACASGGEACP